jgi:hypothetical protein
VWQYGVVNTSESGRFYNLMVGDTMVRPSALSCAASDSRLVAACSSSFSSSGIPRAAAAAR